MAERYRIRWSRPAQRDLDVILEYIASRSGVDAALRVYENLIEATESLVQHPSRRRIVPELREKGIADYRELIASRYRICFRLIGRELVLVAILDGRRDLEQVLFDRSLLS